MSHGDFGNSKYIAASKNLVSIRRFSITTLPLVGVGNISPSKAWGLQPPTLWKQDYVLCLGAKLRPNFVLRIFLHQNLIVGGRILVCRLARLLYFILLLLSLLLLLLLLLLSLLLYILMMMIIIII